MKKTYFLSFLLCCVTIGTFYSCTTKRATVRTYVNPSLNSFKITRVAILPLRNAFVQKSPILTGDLLQINAMIHKEFLNKNPKTTLIDAVTAAELLNKDSLVNSYDKLLQVYENTGIPNTQILNLIGEQLQIDAIMQGFVTEVTQQDSEKSVPAQTKIVIKYVMFSTKTGGVLWEASCEGRIVKPLKVHAPPVFEVIDLVQKKILTALPVLSE